MAVEPIFCAGSQEEPMFSCGVLQEVPMSHKFAALIRTS